MASITIRNLDDETKLLLRVQAAGKGRSMEEEARMILHDSVRSPAPHGGLSEAPAAALQLSWVDRLVGRFQEVGGVELEELPRQAGRAPPDFSGPEFEA